MRKRFSWLLLLILLPGLGLATSACQQNQAQPAGIRTRLLVTAPDEPLAVNRPVQVKSQTEDADTPISHVELYAIESPLPDNPTILIHSDPAPFRQTSFTASQRFIPTLPGHYALRVVGYNSSGESSSDTISFDAR